jgi:hypothetical protein
VRDPRDKSATARKPPQRGAYTGPRRSQAEIDAELAELNIPF